MNQWQDAERHFERALELVQQRKWPAALHELRQAIRINPFNVTWLVNLGMILDEMSRYEEALESYRAASELEPDNLKIQERLAVDQARTGRLRQSIRTLNGISERDPAYEPAYCHRILIHAELGEHDLAEEMFYTARLYKDHCPRCYDHMGRSLQTRGLFDKAIFCFQKCLDFDDAWPDAWRRLAVAYWSKGDLEQARRHFLADLRQNPGRAQTLLDLGDLLMQMGRVEESGEKYRRCIELAPALAGGYWRQGRWLARCHKFAAAKVSLEQALRLDPTSCGVHLELARLALRGGERAIAIEHLRAEHLLGPTEGPMLLALANLWMDCREDRTAIACLKRLLSLEPGNHEAWLNLAVAQFRRGLYQQGIRSCQRALDQESPHPAFGRTAALAMYNLALAYERLGEYSTALDWSRHALHLEPRDGAFRSLELRLRFLRCGWSVVSTVLRWCNPSR